MIDWKRMPGIRTIDIYGYDEIANFDRAFVDCLAFHQHPGPMALTARMRRRRGAVIFPSRNLNGRLTTRRKQLMFLFGIPYKMNQNRYPNIRDQDLGIPKEYYGVLMVHKYAGPNRTPAVLERKG